MMDNILLVDDEQNVLDAYRRQFRKQYHLHTALGGEQGLELLTAQGPFAVVISDCRMPLMDGIEFLTRVRESAPDTVRMMLTGNADLETAMEAVNQGEIFRFLTKPCPPDTFTKALAAGLRQYQLIRAEKELLEQTLTGSLNALADVLSLVDPEAFGRASRLKRYVMKLARQMGLSDVWHLEIAASLSQIGCVTLSDYVVKKINAGEPLRSDETADFLQHPMIGASLLAKIPRMQEVADIIAYQHKHFDGSGAPHDSKHGEEIPLGARLLKVAIDFDACRTQNLSWSTAFARLEEKKEWYDPQVLEALKVLFLPKQEVQLLTVSLGELKPYMIVADGIVDDQDNLLVAAGQEITDWMVMGLTRIGRGRGVKEPIRVLLPATPELSGVPTTPMEYRSEEHTSELQSH